NWQSQQTFSLACASGWCVSSRRATEIGMIVGVPREIKQDEYRVAMLPVGVEELNRAGNRVLVERGAGLGSGISDDMYRENGAEIVDKAGDVFAEADLVVKVKEPQAQEIPLL